MSNTFSTKQNNNQASEDKPFEKDMTDNKLFPSLQVKDLSTIINEDTIGIWDADTPIYQACSNVEKLYIEINHPDFETPLELDGVEKFKGRVKKAGAYSENSWLGTENIKREANGLEPWKLEDFDIEQKNRLKYETEDAAFERVKIGIYTTMKNVRQQFGIEKLKLVIGEGECFRHDLDLPTPYKGERVELRPIMLKRVRKWVLEELECEMAQDGFEADDVVEWYGFKGYQVYKRTGVTPYVVIASDKDAMSNAKILINPDKFNRGHAREHKFKNPHAWVIHDSGTSVGELDMISSGSKKELKGTGLKWLVAQAFCIGDSADSYHPYSKLPKEMKQGIRYGDATAYKDYLKLDSVKDILQKAVDNMYNNFPYGLQYTNHKGEELDVDTLHWLNVCFSVAYMTRSANDNLTFTKLCEAVGVDLSSVTGNNKLSAPERTFIDNERAENKVAVVKEMCENMFKELTGYKQLKKDLLIDKLDSQKDQVTNLLETLEDFYEMVQKEK